MVLAKNYVMEAEISGMRMMVRVWAARRNWLGVS
jgi:hypothetical protein